MNYCMRECGLIDHVTIGPLFTWRNIEEGVNRVYSKIDRVLENEEWDKMYGSVWASFLPESISDHNPCVV